MSFVHRSKESVMTTLTDRATEMSIRIAREIRKLPGIKSVKAAGYYVPKYSEQLYPIAVPGQLPANLSNNIGTYEEQVSEGMPHEAYFSVTVHPENALQAVDTIKKKAKSVLAYTNVAGTGVELFFIRTDADPETGEIFQLGTDDTSRKEPATGKTEPSVTESAKD